MIPHLSELSFMGIGVEPAVVALLLAIIPTDIARRILIRLRVNMQLWNWPLFVLAIYVLVVSGLILALRPL